MKLSYDYFHCPGNWLPLPFAKQLDTQCIDCARRLQTEHGERQAWSTGEVVDGVCLNKIKDES